MYRLGQPSGLQLRIGIKLLITLAGDDFLALTIRATSPIPLAAWILIKPVRLFCHPAIRICCDTAMDISGVGGHRRIAVVELWALAGFCAR